MMMICLGQRSVLLACQFTVLRFPLPTRLNQSNAHKTAQVWVDAAGTVHTATRADPKTWRALNGGLGLIGAITELVLQLTPPTNTQLKTVLNQPDSRMYELVVELLKVGTNLVVSALGLLVARLGCGQTIGSLHTRAVSSISTRTALAAPQSTQTDCFTICTLLSPDLTYTQTQP